MPVDTTRENSSRCRAKTEHPHRPHPQDGFPDGFLDGCPDMSGWIFGWISGWNFSVVFLQRNLSKNSIRKSIRPATPPFHPEFLGSLFGFPSDFHMVFHPVPSGKCAGSSWASSYGTHMPGCPDDDRSNKQSKMHTGKQESNKKLVGKPRHSLPKAHWSHRKLWAHENDMDFAGSRFSCLEELVDSNMLFAFHSGSLFCPCVLVTCQ